MPLIEGRDGGMSDHEQTDPDLDELVDPTDDPVTAREAAELDLMEEDDSEVGAEVGEHLD